MKRITLVLGIVAVMVAMIVAPALAKDDNGHNGNGNKANTAKNDGNHNNGNHNNGINRLDNRLERIDNRVENQLDRLEDSFDDGIEVDFVGDVDSDDVAYYWYYPFWSDILDSDSEVDIDPVDFDSGVDFDSDIDLDREVNLVSDIDVDRDVDFANGKNHNNSGNGKNHNNGGDGKKGNGK